MLEDLEQIYSNRFKETYNKRELTWSILNQYFFQKYIPEDSVVLEIAAGYCHFINNIQASKKYALDMNPDVKKYANKDVETLITPSNNIRGLSDESVDIVFVSNFFEHIEKLVILETLRECRRVLKPNGKIIVLQPNIRYLANDYWMFFDHITPLDERSISEALELTSFSVEEVYPRFLPFTLQGRLPVNQWLIRIYLMLPFAWRFFGKQALVVAKK